MENHNPSDKSSIEKEVSDVNDDETEWNVPAFHFLRTGKLPLMFLKEFIILPGIGQLGPTVHDPGIIIHINDHRAFHGQQKRGMRADNQLVPSTSGSAYGVS